MHSKVITLSYNQLMIPKLVENEDCVVDKHSKSAFSENFNMGHFQDKSIVFES